MRLFVLFVLIMTGLFLGFVLMVGMAIVSGANLSDLISEGALKFDSTMMIRLMLLINHVTMFMLPAIAWSVIYYKKAWLSGLDLNRSFNWRYLVGGIGFLIVAYPIVSKSYEFNQSLDLPSWMSSMESQTEEMLKKILTMETPLALLVNLIVIAIIPGMGEELIFRGILQKELYKTISNPYVAIVIASLLFSALHFQFEGFLPRFFLGLILGLIYYWTGSLWMSICVHAFNNGIQVLLTYLNPEMMDQDFESTIPIKWYALLGSIILTGIVGYWFYVQKRDTDRLSIDLAKATSQNLHQDE